MQKEGKKKEFFSQRVWKGEEERGRGCRRGVVMTIRDMKHANTGFNTT
jgi:hypothetical protein